LLRALQTPRIKQLVGVMFAATLFVGTTDGTGAIWELHKFAMGTILAGSAGIRATVPLFLISLIHQFDAKDVPLDPATEWLGYWFICAGLGVLLIVEVLADTIPAVDHAVHAVLTPVYPIFGALAAASPNYVGGPVTHIIMAGMGAGLAFIFHGGKAASRVGARSVAGGVWTPLQSTAGTAVVMLVVLVAIFLAVVSIFIAVGVICLGVYIVFFLKEAHRRRPTFRGTALAAVAVNRFRQATGRQPQQPSNEAAGTSFADVGQAMRQQPLVEPAPASRPEPNGV